MASRKAATLVEQCLVAPEPLPNHIGGTPAAVLAMEKSFATLEPSQRVQVVGKVVQWYGLVFPWPELSSDEATAFARTPVERFRIGPGERAFLFGATTAQTPGDLGTFNRCLRIATVQHWLQQDRYRKKWLEVIPTMESGPEEARVLGLFLDVKRTDEPQTWLRQGALAFAMKNERWQLFDALIEGFAVARGYLKDTDLLWRSLFPEHAKRVLELHTRLYAANEQGQAFMKPIWAAETELWSATFERFTKHPAAVKALGKSLWLGGQVGDNRDAKSLKLHFPVSKQTGKREQLGTLTAHATRNAKGWRFEVLRFEGGGKVLDLA